MIGILIKVETSRSKCPREVSFIIYTIPLNVMQRACQRLALPVAHAVPAGGSPRGCSSRAGLVGGTRQRHFDGTNFKPHKLPENAQSPTTLVPAFFAGDRVHAARCVGPHLVVFSSLQPNAYVWLMVIMEMVKKFSGQEAFITNPHQVKFWLDLFDADIIW